MRSLPLLLAGLMLAACADNKVTNLVQRPDAFDGVRFRSSLTVDKEDRQRLVVQVPKASRSLDGAREAGRHRGVEYCIGLYGNSKITWVNAGPDADAADLRFEQDSLVFEGRCKGWQ
jgi:hypothetical protein